MATNDMTRQTSFPLRIIRPLNLEPHFKNKKTEYSYFHRSPFFFLYYLKTYKETLTKKHLDLLREYISQNKTKTSISHIIIIFKIPKMYMLFASNNSKRILN